MSTFSISFVLSYFCFGSSYLSATLETCDLVAANLVRDGNYPVRLVEKYDDPIEKSTTAS